VGGKEYPHGNDQAGEGSAQQRQEGTADGQQQAKHAHMPAKIKTALGKQGAAVAQRKRTGSSTPRTRAELYEIAKQRDLPGRSKMGRDELARKLKLK
jgi:hypothetical protein